MRIAPSRSARNASGGPSRHRPDRTLASRSSTVGGTAPNMTPSNAPSSPRPPVGQFLGPPRVAACAEPVDGHHGLLADDPGVVAARKGGDVTRAGDELRAVVHPDRRPAADVVLEVRRLAAVGAGDRLHVLRPPPPRFEHQRPDLTAAD